MDDALKLAREFEHVMCRFRRMDYSVLHPGVGNMEFAVLEMIHKLSAQHDAIYGAAISDLQKKMEEAQEKLAQQEITGTSGGGLVKITLNGKFEAKKIELDKSLLVPEEVDILEDLILAAYNEAHAKVDTVMADGMKDVTGGLNLGGLKLPF